MRPELRRILDDLPPLGPVLERAARRYVRLGRVGGSVEVAPEERRSVERLGCSVDGRGRVKLADLDRVFRASRLAAPLPEVLEDFRGEPLVTRAEARRREEAAWKELREHLRGPDIAEWAKRWLDAEEAALMAEWRRTKPLTDPDPDGAGSLARGDWEAALARALQSAAALEAAGAATELPHLAYRVCGDAHALDPDRTAGRLFERLLLHRHADVGFSLPLSAEDRESLYAVAGLAMDEVSSTVHVVGLEGDAPLLTAARRGRHVLALPLRTVYELEDRVRPHGGRVFAVENRSVLSALHRELAAVPVERYPTLVCTSGHMSLAALRLLERLRDAGGVVRYSGDFDGRGLLIADALARRLGRAFEPWRMDPADYRTALDARRTERRVDPGPLTPGAEARFPELTAAVREHGAAYQEGLLALLLEDLVW